MTAEPPVQTGPAAWLGSEMALRDDWIVQLSATHVAELEAATAPVVAEGETATRALASLTPSTFPLPTLGPLLEAFPDARRLGPQDVEVLRLWLICDGDRPLPPAFATRYGSIEIGDRGGIFVPGTKLNVPLDPE